MVMIFLYSLPLALIAFFLLRNKSVNVRLGVSLALWIVPPLVILVYVLIIGDQMPPDAVIISPAPSGR